MKFSPPLIETADTGWDLDPPDPSVGIFGWLAAHCGQEAAILDDTNPEVFTCIECGSTVDVSPPDLDEPIDPVQYATDRYDALRDAVQALESAWRVVGSLSAMNFPNSALGRHWLNRADDLAELLKGH